MTPDPEPAAIVPGLAAIVLAGGRASRLGGADKPGLVVGARTLLAAVLSAAIEAGAGHVVIGPPRPGFSPPRPGFGPLAGGWPAPAADPGAPVPVAAFAQLGASVVIRTHRPFRRSAPGQSQPPG